MDKTASGGCFLPDYCGIRAAFGVVVGAELLAMVLTLGSDRPLDQLWHRLSLVSLYVQWIGLTSAGLLCVIGRWLRRLTNLQAALAAWVLVLVVTVGVSQATIHLFSGMIVGLLSDDAARWGLLLRSLAIAAIVTALVLRYHYFYHQWRRQLLAESEARLQALQSRIRPHFLFNSMNTIANLTRTDPGLAEEVVQDLADLFRVSLSDASRDSTLGQELDISRRYLNIERQRLGPRLQVEWQLDELPLEARLPPLILQPLLENAVYHGIERMSEPGMVRIQGGYRRQQVNISIRNRLPAHAAEPHRRGNRLAVENIRERLEARFGGAAALTERRAEGEYQVQLVFPHPWVAP